MLSFRKFQRIYCIMLAISLFGFLIILPKFSYSYAEENLEKHTGTQSRDFSDSDKLKDSIVRLMLKNAELESLFELGLDNCFKNKEKDTFPWLCSFNLDDENQPRDTTERNLINSLTSVDKPKTATNEKFRYKAYLINAENETCLTSGCHHSKEMVGSRLGALSIRTPLKNIN